MKKQKFVLNFVWKMAKETLKILKQAFGEDVMSKTQTYKHMNDSNSSKRAEYQLKMTIVQGSYLQEEK